MNDPLPTLNADTGLLCLSDAAFGVVEQLAKRGGDLVDASGLRDQMARLRAVSVLDSEDQIHPSLTSTLAAIRHAETELVLTGTERLARIWVAAPRAALLLPIDDSNLRRLTHLPLWMLPETISRIVGLGPRPRPAGPAVPLSTRGAGDTRSHWTLARIATRPGERDRDASLEIVDTAAGLWVVKPGDDGPMASPSDPTAVWRAIIRLVRPSDTAAQTSQVT